MTVLNLFLDCAQTEKRFFDKFGPFCLTQNTLSEQIKKHNSFVCVCFKNEHGFTAD